MNISVELTLLPLKADFEPPIKDFIKRLRDSEFTVLENPLSTQVYGEYDNVMSFLTKEIKTSFEKEEHIIVNLKAVKSDRSDYEPTF
mgnify:FL=1|jgi:uncharacterized protein YqgV (UPF0045/DUF77 family)